MHKTSVPNGLFLGGAMIICSYVLYIVDPQMFFRARPALLLFVLVLLFLKTAREAKRANGNYISFGSAFKNMFVTGAIAILMCTCFEYLMFNFIATDLTEIKKELELESMEMIGDLLGEQYEEITDMAVDQIEDNQTTSLGNMIQQFISRLFMPVALLAALIGLFVKASPPPGHYDHTISERKDEDHDQGRYIVNK